MTTLLEAMEDKKLMPPPDEEITNKIMGDPGSAFIIDK